MEESLNHLSFQCHGKIVLRREPQLAGGLERNALVCLRNGDDGRFKWGDLGLNLGCLDADVAW